MIFSFMFVFSYICSHSSITFLIHRDTFVCCFFLWFMICLSVNFFSISIFSSAGFLWRTFFPHLTAQSQFPPCHSACLLLLLFVCLVFFLLQCRSHLLIIFPLILPSADTHTHLHNDAGSATAWHQLTGLLLPHFTSLPKKSLWDMLSSSDALVY